jgi:hypothetical protein
MITSAQLRKFVKLTRPNVMTIIALLQKLMLCLIIVHYFEDLYGVLSPQVLTLVGFKIPVQ